MNNMIRGGKLCIETNGDRSTVEIAGTPSDLLFNWTALTYQICKSLHTDPLSLALVMPGMLRDYEQKQLKDSKMERFDAHFVKTGGGQL